MIDLHLHLLPGVDDGPDSLDESVEMCRLAAADGCRTLVATPHLRHQLWPDQDLGSIKTAFDRLQERVSDMIELRLGGEIAIDSSLLDDLDSGSAGPCIPLAGSHYLLLEFSRDGIGPRPDDLIHEVKLQGWRPIVAHPEFIPELAGDRGLVQRLLDAGALIQVTAMSLTGEFGRRIRKVAMELIDSDMVQFVASDAHGRAGRPPGLSRARQEISKQWGGEAAALLTETNARAVLENREIARPSRVLT